MGGDLSQQDKWEKKNQRFHLGLIF
jgi:hypothetical protein